uniref:Cytochrome b561 domain-containing protein n=1 Tax=Oryza brachyantha TaxID=4533 RepID=J3N3W9_ORYBR
MAIPAPEKAARALAAAAAGMVLLWCAHFRGGLALSSPTNKGLIFNFLKKCKCPSWVWFDGKLVHPVLMLIGFIILGSEVGIYAAFKFHNESGIANLYSLHSWVGLGTICLYGVQWVFGFITFFFPGASPTLRRATLPWHVRSGLLVYILALLAAELGFLEKLTFLQAGGLGRCLRIRGDVFGEKIGTKHGLNLDTIKKSYNLEQMWH